MAVLEAYDLTKNYDEGREIVRALRGVCLETDRGEVVALEGPSGSGKTTLLFILGCLLTPTSGRVIIEGREAKHDRLQAIRKTSIGFVFQRFNLFPSLTAAENVEYGLNLRGRRGPAAAREAIRALDAVGLRGRRGALPRDLSGGEKQRVAIARALAGVTPILLVDEPTSSLDQESGSQVLALFHDLAQREDRAILIVSHDPRVRNVANRVLQFRDGRLLIE